jgi:hypothetical protein
MRSAPPLISRRWPAAPPDWVGVGVQRAGTSWWHSMIEAHRDVHALGWTSKELHFFDRFDRDRFDSADVAAYHAHFLRPPGKLCGEWTPRYMFDPWTPGLLHQAAPTAKLLVLLRDPVTRFESGLCHDMAKGETLDQAWPVAFERGLYHRQLARLLEHFEQDQILVLQLERCAQQPAELLQQTFEFLGLSKERAPRRVVRPAVNRRRGPPVDLSDAQRLKLREDYTEDVRLLVADFPQLDVDLWPNFRNRT